MSKAPIVLTVGTHRRLSCRAVLFDLDGVLIDSLATVDRHLRAWASSRDLDADHVVAMSPGRTNADLVAAVAPHLHAQRETEFLVRQDEEDLDGVFAHQGAQALLAALPRTSWAIVTSAYRTVAELRLRHAGLPTPPVLVTADDVLVGKPDPSCYQAAARALGVAPQDCLVIEDAESGIAAAHAAGMRAIGVTNGSGSLRADLVIPSLTRLTIDP
jgi:mannitol-1-/sugar-/sorbitol-6-phosphatase